ncbi:retrovirus-related pol polyprotein from transposon TNT 1-94 [Tanacetum coccineum]
MVNQSYLEALSSIESIQWRKAINEEIVSLEKNQTCSLVRLLAGKKASQRLWMFKVKEEHNGNKRYKARLVVKGFQQKRGVDYNEIFSPVVKMTIIRVQEMCYGPLLLLKKRLVRPPLYYCYRCSEKQVLGYVLTVGVTTVEWVWTTEEYHYVNYRSLVYGSCISKQRVDMFDSSCEEKVCSWAKLVRILISEGSLSLLKILGTKSLAAMFTRLVMKEKLKFYATSTGLRVN